MISLLIKGCIIIALYVTTETIPDGWSKAGSHPGNYETGIINRPGHGKAVYIKSVSIKNDGFGTLMQTFRATRYKNKRMKLTCEIKTEEARKAGLWMRINQTGTTTPIAFDNMNSRPITGTKDWQRYEIVLDVPDNADLIAFGVLLVGSGNVCFNNVSFLPVDKSVPVTAPSANTSNANYPSQPVNLNFE